MYNIAIDVRVCAIHESSNRCEIFTSTFAKVLLTTFSGGNCHRIYTNMPLLPSHVANVQSC